ncbi:MAG: methyltransferase family protein [Candidatus Bathyarchaeia archaeon]
MFIAVILHVKSVAYVRLEEKYGQDKGVRIGKIYGTISGIMEFTASLGLWLSSQPRFTIPTLSNLSITVLNFSTPILHLIVSLPLILFGAWIALKGVKAITFKVAETHCAPKRLETSGVYSIVRHPQYFGWVLTHFGMSLLLSAWYSLLFTPISAALIYLIAKKEEEGLISKFGEKYKDYQKKVPMLIPSLAKIRAEKQ